MTLLLIYVSMALVFSFLCSIAEAVLLSVTPSFVAALVIKGKPSGTILRRLERNIDRPLAAILSLNTIAHTVGAVGAGAQATVVFGSGYVGAASAVLTLLILVLSEIIPKTLGATYWRTLAPATARGVTLLIWILYPLVLLSERLTKLLSRSGRPSAFSREEFAAMADIGAKEGKLETKESHILKNLFRLRTLRVKDVMTPRPVVFALQENMLLARALEEHGEIPFSRIPIYRGNSDEITGYVLKNDLLLAHAKDQEDSQLLAFKREITAVPETLELFDLMERLLDLREHIVLVVDEYGGTEGIATLEDVVETLLGLEIVDEADQTVDMQALARAQWEKRARNLGLLEEKEPPPASEE